MMAEYIFELNEALYNEETGEACFKPTVKGELVRCKDCKFRDTECAIWGIFMLRDDDYCSLGEQKK